MDVRQVILPMIPLAAKLTVDREADNQLLQSLHTDRFPTEKNLTPEATVSKFHQGTSVQLHSRAELK